MSRDGGVLAWVGGSGSSRRLWVHAIDQLQGRALDGTVEASSPFFSPDGEWVAFFTTTELKKIKISGGAERARSPQSTIAGGAAHGATTGPSFLRQASTYPCSGWQRAAGTPLR